MNKINIFVRVFVLTVLIYFIFAAIENIKVNQTSLFSARNFAYYNYIIDAFLHGRTNLIGTHSLHDLSVFNHKYYMYWGPAPILFILPFYILFGLHASDIFYTVLAGICNVVLFYFVIKEFIYYFKLKITENSQLVLLVNFAFVSPHLFLSTYAGIWHTNQIIALFYLLIFYLSFLKFLRNNKMLFLLLSIIFFNLAWFSRYIFVFNAVLFLFPIVTFQKERKKIFKQIALPFTIVTGLFIIIFMLYNFVRFNSFFETGHKYVRGNPMVFSDPYLQQRVQKNTQAYQSDRIFTFKYIPENISYYFFNHLSISDKSPFLNIDKEGNSIFSVYPLFIITLYLFQKKYFRSSKIIYFVIFSTICILLNIVIILSLVRYSHWAPFGTRYILDIIPLLYLLFLFIIEDVPIVLLYGLTFYGVLINFFWIVSSFILLL